MRVIIRPWVKADGQDISTEAEFWSGSGYMGIAAVGVAQFILDENEIKRLAKELINLGYLPGLADKANVEVK